MLHGGLQGGAVASGGLRELIPAVARACVAVGIDGIFMEVCFGCRTCNGIGCAALRVLTEYT